MIVNYELEEVYQRQFSRVYRICLFLLKNRQDAEDSCHNIFIKYIKKQPKFENLEHEKAWFIRVSRNQCNDFFKLFWNKNKRELSTQLPDLSYEDKSIQIDLLTELMDMPSKFGLTLYLYYYEEYSVKEIVRVMDIKESTIQSRLHHGRRKLKNILGDDYYEE